MANELRPPSTPPEPPEWFGKFLEIQAKEIEERAEERKLRAQNEQNQFELAKLSLSAQERALAGENNSVTDRRRDTYMLIGFLVLLVIALVGIAMWLDKDAIAIEIVKAAVFLTAGGAGGYAVGRGKSRSESDDDNA